MLTSKRYYAARRAILQAPVDVLNFLQEKAGWEPLLAADAKAKSRRELVLIYEAMARAAQRAAAKYAGVAGASHGRKEAITLAKRNRTREPVADGISWAIRRCPG